MSSNEQEIIGQLDVSMMSEMLIEPMYLSELARKMQELNLPMGYNPDELEDMEQIKNTWGDVSSNTALTGVMIGLSLLTRESNNNYEVVEQGYDTKGSVSGGTSQSIGSVHLSRVAEGETQEWEPYSIVKNTGIEKDKVGDSLVEAGYGELASKMLDMVDETVSIEDKAGVAQELSRAGNIISEEAERIMQDVFKRQFREYDNVISTGYNDAGADFAVQDGDRRDYGLIIEVSTRWVNPIGDPYISSKISTALDLEEKDVSDQPWDVVILAPKFTVSALQEHESPLDVGWHDDPDEGMVHLHHVPDVNPGVYRPFAKSPDEFYQDDSDTGNPVIVPDSDKLRERIEDSGLVGRRYPVVDGDHSQFREYLDSVFRDFVVVTESRYRNMLREAIEPLLWEFMRPYKVEQFLVDMYWDKGLNQSEIGSLVDRSGSTIGTWMREFGVMRRGTGAPELTDDTKEIWRRMYEGEEPFPQQFSGYRVQAEYNRHPHWGLDDWREWYQGTTENERKENMSLQESFRDNLDYTVITGVKDRLTPSYSFILSTLKDMGVDVRDPDEAPRVPYSAYPSRGALEYMINKDGDTIVDVSE